MEPEAPPPPPKKEEKPDPKPAKPKETAPSEAPFSAAWLRKNLDRLRDEAIDAPDDKNKVRAYLYAQRILLDKAQNFSNAAHMVASTDPILDESNRMPLDTAAKMAVMRGTEAAKKTALKTLADKGGIFFFFDASCRYCATQQQALSFLVSDYSFKIRNISVDGRGLPGMSDWKKDTGLAKTLGLKIFPTTVFVVPPDGYYIISQGYHSAETLGNKIMLAAMDQKLLPPDVLAATDTLNRGVMSADDMRDQALLDAVNDAKDSAKWVDMVREKLGMKY